jgi:hypothetical protein
VGSTGVLGYNMFLKARFSAARIDVYLRACLLSADVVDDGEDCGGEQAIPFDAPEPVPLCVTM